MAWLNLNQSLSSLKGQITNFASEVLSEPIGEGSTDVIEKEDSIVKELEDKCRSQELEIASLKKINDELQAEKLSGKNGVREDDSSWYWDPPPQLSNPQANELDSQYQVQIRHLQKELSDLREKQRNTIDLRPGTDEELNRLREENKNLTTNLDDLDNQHQLAMERLLSLKRELQKNFEVLKKEHEDLKSANDEFASEKENILIKLGERDKEIEQLRNFKSDFETLHHKYQNLERIHSLLKENAEKFQEENQDLHEEIFKLQEQVTKLEHDLEIATKRSELSDSVPKERYEQLNRELNELKDRWNSNHNHLDEVNIDDNAKSVIENLKREINELKHQLSQKESEHHESDQKTVRTDKIMQLYNKYVNFDLPVDYVGEIPLPGDNVVLYKLESIFKTVHSFKKDIDTLEHQLSEKNLNANHLQTQIDDLTNENDFLTTDIQHYERELNEMKKNNDFLISEIAALKNTSKLEPIIETHEDNLAKLETELADCTKMNKTFESEIKRIENELSEVRTEKVILQENLNDLKSKYTTMLTELDIYKNQAQEVEELEHTTNTEQAKMLTKKSAEIDNLTKRLDLVNTKNEQLAIDIAIIENDKVLLLKEIDELKNLLHVKGTDLKNLQSSNVTLNLQLKEITDKYNELTTQRNEIESQRNSLLEKLLVIELQNSEHDAQLSDKEHMSEKLNKLAAENSNLITTVQNLKSELLYLENELEKVTRENAELKSNPNINNQSTILSQELKIKDQDELLYNETKILKEEKDSINKTNMQLEKQFLNAESKIIQLEEEFNKLDADLNAKDSIIYKLNSTIESNNDTIEILHRKIDQMKASLDCKNKECDDLKISYEKLQNKFNDCNYTSNSTQEEITRVLAEKEDMSKQVYALNEDLLLRYEEITNLTSRLNELKTTCDDQINSINIKEQNIQELNKTILEMSEKLNSIDNVNGQNETYSGLHSEKEISELKIIVAARTLEISELKAKCELLEKSLIEYKSVNDTINAEKAELINLINLKHNESLQYHNEIQRLNHALLEQSNEFKRILEDKEKIVQNTSTCSNCENFRVTLKEKDEIIKNITHQTGDNDKLRIELVNASESLNALTAKCDNLELSLASSLETIKKLTAEKTQELMASEQKLTEVQARLHQIEERAKQNSTVYTSNSIRANQEVETLRNQIKLLEKQREDVQGKLSEAEDARSRSEVALTNLQVVLEQFQL
ncbi:hypothetical protein ACJJTC_000264, partial [Scirpophaga incertulas]